MDTVTELSHDGNLRLILAVIVQACEDGDREFIMSDRCTKLLSFIPQSMLSNALGDALRSVSTKDLSLKLLKKIDSGFFKIKRPKITPTKVVKTWEVVHPCGFTEIVDSLKEFAEEVGILPSGLANVANNAGRSQYLGYKVRKLS